MSNSTPPGWYPDPEPAPGAQGAHERFWDGSGWTARTRPLPSPVGAFAPGAAPRPAAPPPSPPAGQPAAPPSARPVAAGPSQPATSLSDASPAYGHPAIPEPESPGGYGYPAIAPGPAASLPPSAPAPGPVPQAPPAALPPYAYQPPGYPQPGSPPPYPPSPPAPGGRTGLVVGLLAGGLALIAVGTGVSISLVKGSAQTARPAGIAAPGRPAPPPGTGTGSSPGAAPQSPSPLSPDGGSVQDTLHGWSIPLPSGWDSAQHDASTAALLVTGAYQCATPGGCVRGNFAVDSNPAAGPDAETVARRTMADYAPQLFGPLGSHQELTSGPITVAGVTGFAVRWHVVPQQTAPGFLLLVALPAPGGGFTTLVGSVDDDPRAPAPAVLDQIAIGIRPAGVTAGPSSTTLPPNAT
ncbi:DUF2510 domain-containing protein [Kitasatospora sp. NBC_01266]|uniref:DUF2510 domain-containing protein n=1 Tax=Kitasatospora sp. NBC_01266 TaxID=2903572 RepID=UPI002E359399|nr:DUF2510 domain-containing protein [Kitasatospora sp. NBC_01266]